MIDASQITVTRNLGSHVAARVVDGPAGPQTWILDIEIARRLGLEIPEKVTGYAHQSTLVGSRDVFLNHKSPMRVPFYKMMRGSKRSAKRKTHS